MLKYKFYIRTVLLALVLHSNECIKAQVKIQVVSKKISKTINWSKGMNLEIMAEKAEIFCSTHLSRTIEVDVEFIAKNEKRDVAEADLNKMKWLNETINKKVFLRNYIELSKNESKPSSDIKAVYHLKIPENCALNIKNYFGYTEIENLNSDISITNEFGKINLNNVQADVSVKTTFGDITAKKINGNIHIDSERSDIELQDISGNTNIHSYIAEITISRIYNAGQIKINADKSRIYFRSLDYTKYFFDFDVYSADFRKPDGMILNYSVNTNERIKGKYNNLNNLPVIEIRLTAGSLTIN